MPRKTVLSFAGQRTYLPRAPRSLTREVQKVSRTSEAADSRLSESSTMGQARRLHLRGPLAEGSSTATALPSGLWFDQAGATEITKMEQIP